MTGAKPGKGPDGLSIFTTDACNEKSDITMKFYIVASLLLLVATLVDIRAKSIAAEASLCVAELAQGEKHEQDAESLHSEIQDIRLRAGTYHLAGWLFCATGVGCIFVSRWRKEKGTMVVPIVLIALYLLMMIQQV